MNPEEYNTRLSYVLKGLERHLGTEATKKCLEKATYETKDEFDYNGATDEKTIQENILWKLEARLDRCFEEEMT